MVIVCLVALIDVCVVWSVVGGLGFNVWFGNECRMRFNRIPEPNGAKETICCQANPELRAPHLKE